jgi:hypothetical protein
VPQQIARFVPLFTLVKNGDVVIDTGGDTAAALDDAAFFQNDDLGANFSRTDCGKTAATPPPAMAISASMTWIEPGAAFCARASVIVYVPH